MTALKYLALWLIAFVGISVVDAFWHLVIWGKIYREGIKKVASVVDEKLVFNNISGLLSQCLVITAFVVLCALNLKSDKPYLMGFISCMMGGILGISVYGLVNHWLIKDWGLTITTLEVIWGPLIGSFAGLFIVWAGKLLKI
jgi:uncharacterized membrane protein